MTEDNKNPFDFERVEKGKSRVKARTEKTGAERNKGKVFSLGNIFLAIVGMVFLGAVLVIVAEITKTDPAILLILLILAILVIAAGIYSIYTFFAPRDLFWGGVPEEGTACTIVAGTENREGKFIKAQISFTGSKLDKDWNVVPDEEFQKRRKSFLEQIGLGGIFWIGIPGIRRRYNHLFSWSSILPNGELDPHEGTFDYIPLKEDTYATLILEAETAKSMVPMNITLLITAKVINPMKARHKVDHWLQSVINLIKVPVLAYIAQLDNPRELIGNKELIDLFFKGAEMSKLVGYFKNEYGIEVSRVNVVAISLGKEEEEAAMLKWKAERTAEALVTAETGRGDAYDAFMKKKREADREYYEMVKDLGDLGITMRYLETAEKASNVVIPFGMVGDIAKQILGGGGNKSFNKLVKLLERAGITEDDIEDFAKAKEAIKEADKEE